MNTQKLIALTLLAFASSTAIVELYRRSALKIGLLDVPNERSSHVKITPRGGGVAFIAVWTLLALWQWTLFDQLEAIGLILGGLIIAAVGFCDDLFQVKARTRAMVHLLASAVLVASAYRLSPSFALSLGASVSLAAAVIATLGIAWSVNMFNFMDGMDGLAAMEAIFVFGVGGYILWERSQSMMAASALVLAAAVAGFLVWNRPPARIFMGDAGSGFLGFMVGAFAVLSMVLYQVPILVWIILYAVFWYDATATLIRRILAKEKWYAAHRSHAYQRLHHLAKWSHARVLKHAIGLNLLLAALALIGYENPGLLPALLAIALILLTVVYGAIERIAPFRTQKTQAYITQDQG